MFYETAAHSHIDKLNKSKSKCLRIALGARATSPVISLEAESHIPPLNIHRMLVLLKYYCRVCEMPNNIPLTKIYLLKLQECAGNIIVPPLVIRSRKLLMKLNQKPVAQNFTPIISPIPPWIDSSAMFITVFVDIPVKLMPNSIAKITLN